MSYNIESSAYDSMLFNSVSSSGGIISGQVTNSGSPIEGAKVYLIDEELEVLTAVTTTDSVGNYEFTELDISHTYHVAVSWVDGAGNFYNTESKPFIQPSENE